MAAGRNHNYFNNLNLCISHICICLSFISVFVYNSFLYLFLIQLRTRTSPMYPMQINSELKSWTSVNAKLPKVASKDEILCLHLNLQDYHTCLYLYLYLQLQDHQTCLYFILCLQDYQTWLYLYLWCPWFCILLADVSCCSNTLLLFAGLPDVFVFVFVFAGLPDVVVFVFVLGYLFTYSLGESLFTASLQGFNGVLDFVFF